MASIPTHGITTSPPLTNYDGEGRGSDRVTLKPPAGVGGVNIRNVANYIPDCGMYIPAEERPVTSVIAS